jgi:hypothetical protein
MIDISDLESRLFALFDDRSIWWLVDGYDRSDPDEVECIVYLTGETTESELATTIFSSLGNISDIPDRFAIEIGEFLEIKEGTRVSKISDLSDDPWECGVYIGLIEFSFECEYLDTSIGRWLVDLELSEHGREG